MKNYCSQICRDADEAAHKVCCNPDKEQRRIDGRKIKLGGRDRIESGDALVDSVAETLSASSFLPSALHKNLEQILEKTKKGKPTEKLSKKNIGCIFHKTLQL